MAHKILPHEQEIDLLNVAFENPRVIKAASSLAGLRNEGFESGYEACPDRMTGRASHAELSSLCQGRSWHFVPINIPFEELTEHRATILELMWPHDTEMDFSISCALYFASRGSGLREEDAAKTKESYVTPAQVLLSGFGADELFGGYSRHAAAYRRGGPEDLVKELRLDFERIAKRNLGRDDRVISTWGKEVRYPYLDEDLVSWALQTPVLRKCAFGQGNDEATGLDPSKRLLRLAAWNLGLHKAAREPKRAIQFGARTAKMTNGKAKGTQTVRR